MGEQIKCIIEKRQDWVVLLKFSRSLSKHAQICRFSLKNGFTNPQLCLVWISWPKFQKWAQLTMYEHLFCRCSRENGDAMFAGAFSG